MTPPRPELAVGGIVISDGHLLLVQRGKPPAVGLWTVPGGRVEWGETMRAAVERELGEETGVHVHCGDLIGWVERISEEHHFVIANFAATVSGVTLPALRAGDDASDAAWVPLAEIARWPLVRGLEAFLQDNQLLRPVPPE